jgi:hypothetical protein
MPFALVMVAAIGRAWSSEGGTGCDASIGAPIDGPVDPAADEHARKLFLDGKDLYDRGDFAGAVTVWDRAWKLSRRPRLLYNMANACEALGDKRDAARLLAAFRPSAKPDELPEVDQRLAALAAASPSTPPAPVPPPTDAVVGPGTSRTATENPQPTGVIVGSDPGTQLKPVDVIRPAPVHAPRHVRAAPVVLFTVSALSAGGGVAFGQLALDARAEASPLCATVRGATWCKAGAEDALTRDARWSLGADLAWGVGIATFAGGLVTALVPTPGTVHATIGPLPGGALAEGGVVGMSGTF